MNRLSMVGAFALLVPALLSAQQSLTPPGMPSLRPIQERPTEVKDEGDKRDEAASSSVQEEGGSLSFGPSRADTTSREDAPTALTPPPAVTTRPVDPNAAMPPLNVRATPPGLPPHRLTGTPAEGERAPVRSVPPAAHPSAPQGRQTPSQARTQPDEIDRLEREVAEARFRLPAASTATPSSVGGGQIPAPEMTVKPGVPVVFNIARQHLNRIVTPYASPFVKTTTEGTTATVEGRIVYVASSNPGPVSLFIGDDSDPVNALAVTVIPRDIPAVQVTLKVEGYEPSVQRPMNAAAAERFELSQPFLQTIRELFRSLAVGEVPSGYGMTQIRGAHPMMPDCPMTGVRFRAMQELSGSHLVVLVARAANVGRVPVSLNEEMCASDHVVAVAAWPHRDLAPGQATEVYIALRRPEERRSTVRPSVLMGN